jgi:hypothetical protein
MAPSEKRDLTACIGAGRSNGQTKWCVRWFLGSQRSGAKLATPSWWSSLATIRRLSSSATIQQSRCLLPSHQWVLPALFLRHRHALDAHARASCTSPAWPCVSGREARAASDAPCWQRRLHTVSARKPARVQSRSSVTMYLRG